MPRKALPQPGHPRNPGFQLNAAAGLPSGRQSLEPDPNLPRARSVELRKIDHLPGAKPQFSMFDRPSEVIAQHRGLEMRGRIALAMEVAPILPRHSFFQGQIHVMPHIRIRAFLNRHSRRSVGNDHVEQSIPPSPLGGSLLQKLCNGHKFGMAPCGDHDLFHG